MNLPTLTGVERAADDFAVLTALELGKKDFSDRILIESAKGWFTSARREKRARSTPDYYDLHGLDVRRANRIVCLMVGADPVRFKALAEETMLPRAVRRTCGWDYDRASRSWETVLMPHRPAVDQPKARIEVIYRAATGNLEVYAQVFRNLRFLETIAELAARPLCLARPDRDGDAKLRRGRRRMDHPHAHVARLLRDGSGARRTLSRTRHDRNARSRPRVGEAVAMQTAMRICLRSDKAARFSPCAVAIPLQSEARVLEKLSSPVWW